VPCVSGSAVACCIVMCILLYCEQINGYIVETRLYQDQDFLFVIKFFNVLISVTD